MFFFNLKVLVVGGPGKTNGVNTPDTRTLSEREREREREILLSRPMYEGFSKITYIGRSGPNFTKYIARYCIIA